MMVGFVEIRRFLMYVMFEAVASGEPITSYYQFHHIRAKTESNRHLSISSRATYHSSIGFRT